MPRLFATCARPAAPAEQIALVEAYCKEQGMFHDANTAKPTYTETLGSISRQWSQALQARAGRRIALHSRT